METYLPFLPFIQETFCEDLKTFKKVSNLSPQKWRVIHRYKQVIHSPRWMDKKMMSPLLFRQAVLTFEQIKIGFDLFQETVQACNALAVMFRA